MKQIRKMVVAAFGAVVLLGLAGCQLAVPGQGSADADQFAGVFVTRQPVDLSASDGRFYATRVASPFGGSRLVFSGLSGSIGGIACVADAEALHCFTPMDDIPGFNSPVADFSPGFERDANTLRGSVVTVSGTMYVPFTAAGSDGGWLYFNPVYWTADGRMYLTAGEKYSATFTSPGSMTWNSKPTYGQTLDGWVRTDWVRASLTVEPTVVPDYLVIKDFAADNTLLSQQQYAADEVPSDLISVAAGTGYVVVESHAASTAGQPTMVSSVVNKGEYYNLLGARADGAIGFMKWVCFDWPK